MKMTVTITTIHVPTVLEKLEANRAAFGRSADYVIVADRKTPPAAGAYVEQLKRQGVPVEYLSVECQIDYLKRFPDLNACLPFDSFARRNIGDLWAYEQGADVIIRIDDDNFPVPDEDFFGGHGIVGQTLPLPSVRSSDGLYNCCELLASVGDQPFYPRGYPYPQRWQPQTLQTEEATVHVKLCQGLWLGDPDVDAVTRLHRPIESIALKNGVRGVAPAVGTWCPINTQNTSYHRDLIPAAFVPANVGRYDDIFSGYCLRAVMDAFGDAVVYGRPLLLQERNAHDLWKDLEHELFGNRHVPHLIDLLRKWSNKSSSYGAAYADLAAYLRDNITEGRAGYQVLWEGMMAWSECFG